MFPDHKALVKRHQNDPFALIGVNTDPDKAEFRKQTKRHGITWRSSFQGSTDGPLCRAWGVRRFPTIYVLDGRGIVRHKDISGPTLDRAVASLLAEQKTAGANR